MPNVLVSVPTVGGFVKSALQESLCNMSNAGCDLIFQNVGDYGIAMARNIMARNAISGGYDWLLMVDSDMVVPKNGLELLLSHERDICMGWYVRGTSDDGRTSAAKFKGRDHQTNWNADELEHLASDGGTLLKVKGNGLGFALVNVDLLKRIPQPIFEFVECANGYRCGEDYTFCQKCADYGIDLFIDVRVRCGHIHDRML
jgi:hypothetical protein